MPGPGSLTVDFGGLSGFLLPGSLPQSPLEKVGGFAPHLFQWIFRMGGAAQTIATSGPEAQRKSPEGFETVPGGDATSP